MRKTLSRMRNSHCLGREDVKQAELIYGSQNLKHQAPEIKSISVDRMMFGYPLYLTGVHEEDDETVVTDAEEALEIRHRHGSH